MNKKHAVDFITTAYEILQAQKFAALNDPDYPMEVDLTELTAAKLAIDKAELFLDVKPKEDLQPPLHKTDVMRLREKIETQLGKVTAALRQFDGREVNYGGMQTVKATLENVLKMIDDL